MKVIVCGAGLVGGNIARYLSGAGNDVIVVDQNPELTQRMSENLDIKAVLGFASHPEILELAGAEDADILIAVTQADEVNMVACQVGHSLFQIPTKIARIRHQGYRLGRFANLFSRENMPIDHIISPEVEVARAITRRLEVPGATEVIPFCDDLVRVIGLRCHENCPVLDTPLRQLTYLFPELHLICTGIVRGDRLFVPHGDDRLIAGDEVYFVAETTHVPRAMPAFGHEETPARRVLILGSGNIGLFLAHELEDAEHDVAIKMIESDSTRGAFVADRLHNGIVLHGDARDPELLAEANVRAMDAVVALTNNDDVNVMGSLLAKKLGANQALALVNNQAYGSLASSLGIDVVINPRETTVSSVLRHVRRGRIRSVFSIRDGEAEIFEAEALETSPLVGKPLREAGLPPGLAIGAIVREGQVIVPRGGTQVRPNDRVVVMAQAGAVKKVEKLFAVRFDFF
ncbi:MAG: Trk system potassium transporter TrkA [Geminicoccaceae bacterium]